MFTLGESSMRILQLPFGEAPEEDYGNGCMASREFPLTHSSQVQQVSGIQPELPQHPAVRHCTVQYSKYKHGTVAHRAYRALRPINIFFAVPVPARPFTNFSFFFSPDCRFCFNSSFVNASLVSEGEAFLVSAWLVRGLA